MNRSPTLSDRPMKKIHGSFSSNVQVDEWLHSSPSLSERKKVLSLAMLQSNQINKSKVSKTPIFRVQEGMLLESYKPVETKKAVEKCPEKHGNVADRKTQSPEKQVKGAEESKILNTEQTGANETRADKSTTPPKKKKKTSSKASRATHKTKVKSKVNTKKREKKTKLEPIVSSVNPWTEKCPDELEIKPSSKSKHLTTIVPCPKSPKTKPTKATEKPAKKVKKKTKLKRKAVALEPLPVISERVDVESPPSFSSPGQFGRHNHKKSVKFEMDGLDGNVATTTPVKSAKLKKQKRKLPKKDFYDVEMALCPPTFAPAALSPSIPTNSSRTKSKSRNRVSAATDPKTEKLDHRQWTSDLTKNVMWATLFMMLVAFAIGLLVYPLLIRPLLL